MPTVCCRTAPNCGKIWLALDEKGKQYVLLYLLGHVSHHNWKTPNVSHCIEISVPSLRSLAQQRRRHRQILHQLRELTKPNLHVLPDFNARSHSQRLRRLIEAARRHIDLYQSKQHPDIGLFSESSLKEFIIAIYEQILIKARILTKVHQMTSRISALWLKD